MAEQRVARLPDGTELRFPAETADDVMDRAVQQHVQQAGAVQQGREANARAPIGDNLQRSIISGLTFGLSDEFNAGVRALSSGLPWHPDSNLPIGDRYERALAAERGRNAAYAEESPVASTVGNFVGGVVGPGLALRGASAGAGLTERMLRSAPARGAVAGAFGGAASGFGEAQGGAENRLDGAVSGGALGAAGGAALGAGLNLAGRVGGRVLDAVGLRNPEVAADRQVLRAFERDGISLDDVRGRLASAPEGTILPDVAGRNTVNLAAVTANTPSRAQEVADTVTQTRRAGSPDRLAAAGDAAFGGGSGDDVSRIVADLSDRRRVNARPLYERSWRIQLTPDEYGRVSRFVEDPIGQEAMRRGLRVVEIEHLARGEEFNPAQYGLRRVNGELVPVDGATPNMRLMDAVKRGFDEIVEGFRDGTTGVLRLDQYGNAVNQARAAYRDTLAEMFPPYRRALEAWAGPSQSMDAVQRGRQAFRTDRDRVAETADRLSENDADFMRVGAGRAFSDMTSDPARAPGAARRLLEDRQMQARLRTLLPDEARREALVAALQREVSQAQVDRAVSPRAGSQTARLLAAGDDMGVDPPGGTLMAMLDAGSRGGLTGMLSRAGTSIYRRGQGINPSTADALAERLFNLDPAANTATLERLTGRAFRDAQVAELRRGLMARLLRGGAVAANDQDR